MFTRCHDFDREIEYEFDTDSGPADAAMRRRRITTVGAPFSMPRARYNAEESGRDSASPKLLGDRTSRSTDSCVSPANYDKTRRADRGLDLRELPLNT